MDSAEYYAHKLKPFIPHEANKLLLSASQARHAYDSVFKYSILYETALDSLHHSMSTEAMARMNALYNYHHFQHQAELTSAKAASERQFYRSLITIILLLLLITYYFIQRKWKKKQAQNARLSESYAHIKAEYQELQQELTQISNSSEEQKKNKQREIDMLHAQLETLEQRFMKMSEKEKEKALCNSHIAAIFRDKADWRQGKSTPTNNEWKQLVCQFQQNMPKTYDVISSLSTQERQACILFILGFDSPSATILLNVSVQQMTNIKSKINSKLFGEKSAKTLISNLQSLNG